METSIIHKFIKAENAEDRRTLLVLHGTGGSEDDLVPLAREIAPGLAILSPRGQVLENGRPRYFRRFAEGVFDLSDLRFRVDEMTDFIENASAEYGFDRRRILAIGYSNGANMAAAMILLRPEILESAILFRALVPLVPETLPDLRDKSIFIAAGKDDAIIPAGESEQIAGLLEQCGAKVKLCWLDEGHEITDADVQEAKEWLAEYK